MKELSIEEKARRYDEAVKKLKVLHDDWAFTQNRAAKEVEEIFHELKESEDERIMEKVISTIHLYYGEPLEDEAKEMIAWLEKQKVLTTEEDLQGKEDVLWCIKQAKKHAKDENEMGTCWFAEKWLEKQGEKPVNGLKITAGNWYVCDIEVMNENMITAFHRGEVYYCPKDGYIDVNGMLFEVGDLDVFRLATKEEIPQQKQEWSEEDNRMLDKCIKAACSNYYPGISSVRDWLNSLKNRYTWKPSDLPHWKKSTLPDNTTGFNSDYFCYKGYNINYKELFKKLPKDGEMRGRNCCYKNDIACEDYE